MHPRNFANVNIQRDGFSDDGDSDINFPINNNFGSDKSDSYDMNTPIEDLQAEFESIKKEMNLNANLKMSKNILISTCSALEYLNGAYDPINVELNGWSEEINEDVESGDYDQVLEEIYDKYYDKIQTGPEMKLLLMIGGSAVKFHIAQTVMKKMIPDGDILLKQNPELQEGINKLLSETKQVKDINNAINNAHKGTVGGLGNKSDYTFQGPDDADDILRELEEEADNEDNRVFSMNF